MESSLASIQALVDQIKQEMFSTSNFYSFVSPSAYDTAWIAMVPHTQQSGCPMFKGYLDWVLNNQKEEGFWGEVGNDGLPTIDSLPTTLACMVALKTWGVGQKNIKKGLEFIHANSKMLLKLKGCHLPRWFAIVFPAMVELAQAAGLEVVFPIEIERVISNISFQRQQILETEELVDKYHYPPLLSYLEALPPSYVIHSEDIVMNLSEDGSLFQSPSATAHAFLATRNQKCMDYIESLVQRCPNGVPPMYPVDEELISLCMVNQIQRLGLAEHFTKEIEEILERIYRTYKNQELEVTKVNLVPAKIFKDSLAFRLLRMHGYDVTPRSFCWFLYQEDIMVHMEQNSEYFASVLYNVYRATDLMFSGEFELQQARLFSSKLLEKVLTLKNENDNLAILPNFHRVIEHELGLPWIARLDHLDHRMWIEVNKVDTLWIGKACFYRLSCMHNDKLMQLAVENYEFRRSIYRNELDELKRWSKEWGLGDMGFGREKTTYCYFAVASSTSLPHNSVARMIVAKSAILVTVADDFFDMEGSLNDLQNLTLAVQRWDGKGLSGHGKIIFCALDNFVSDIAAKHLHQKGSDIMENLQDMWRETFVSWMTETMWSKSGYLPSMDEYIETGMTSIATNVIALPASCFLNPSLPNYKLKPTQYETITELLMASARLLNDIQSYQKEIAVGKKNLVMLYLNENPQADMENSIAYVKEMLDEKKKELLKHALIDGFNDLPKPCKHFHLSCLKVFQMFFNSNNIYDSTADLLHDIKKAIYSPLEYQIPKPLKPLRPWPTKHNNESSKVQACFIKTFKYQGTKKFIGQQFTRTNSRMGCEKVIVPPKFNLCFI
ncbi:(E,E)-geranyllinalool synthase [Camellia lanceoleosa]|uniref:(E,E)-geranyllinalool synthase n=1 Tax=Camellia lanceoleosa TaxID=1840588 RepID=A0ACC0GIJ7_9ERIC|nr:(E,E)-geranyllinalool synthase [Camellia lanceoleosa]